MPSSSKPLTLVLGAMPSEIVSLEAVLASPREDALQGYPYRRGTIGKRRVVIAVSGVGITNAAMAATVFVTRFRPKELLFTGSGARLHAGIRTGDIIISKKTAHHNAGSSTPRGMLYRKVRGPLKGQMTPFEFSADPRLLRLARTAAKSFEARQLSGPKGPYLARVLEGKVCSGDVFGVTPAKIQDIRSKLGSDLIEMEGAAAAQVCWQLGVPHLVIRSGSNLAQPNPGTAYRKLGQIAAHQAARFTAHLVERLG